MKFSGFYQTNKSEKLLNIFDFFIFVSSSINCLIEMIFTRSDRVAIKLKWNKKGKSENKICLKSCSIIFGTAGANQESKKHFPRFSYDSNGFSDSLFQPLQIVWPNNKGFRFLLDLWRSKRTFAKSCRSLSPIGDGFIQKLFQNGSVEKSVLRPESGALISL